MIPIPAPDKPGEKIVVPLRVAIAIASGRRPSPEEARERAAAKRRRYYLRHREEILARQRAYREANPDKERSRWKRYYAAHREELIVRMIQRRAASGRGEPAGQEASA